jgi:hypothetical protein
MLIYNQLPAGYFVFRGEMCMPVELRWHPSEPILEAVYSGTLTPQDYYDMVKRRQNMLEQAAEPVILLVDISQMEGFKGSDTVKRAENIFRHSRIHRTLIVIPENLYRALLRPIVDTAGQDRPVQFFQTINAALDRAHHMMSG